MLDLTLEKKPKRKVSILQFLPKRLEHISTDKHIYWKDDKLKVSYIVDILHNLILKYYFTKENYFNLSSLILRSKYGYLYSRYMNFLVENNYLHMVSNYCVNKKTKSYVIDSSILSSLLEDRYKNQDVTLLKKYNKSIENNRNTIISKIDPHIRGKLVSDLYNISVIDNKAIYFLDKLKDDIDSFNRNSYSVQSIQNEDIFYHFDDHGRFHTNFTILKSEIRKNCLLINNEETYELDLNNSQPLFLSNLIKRSFLNRDVDKEEFQLFRTLSMRGDIYEYIMNKSGINDRKYVKKLFYQVFFGKNYNTKSDRVFKSIFPTIYNFIKKIKKVNDNYKILSHELQSMESNFIYNNVINEIYNLHPEISIFTVHDSIICQKKYSKIVENIFNRKITEEFFHYHHS
jgi:hypothetical protein